MRVFTRKKGESIVVREDIIVSIVEIREDHVRLSIEAPDEEPVHKREVLKAIRRSDSTQPQNGVF